jgi:hypothetical protein
MSSHTRKMVAPSFLAIEMAYFALFSRASSESESKIIKNFIYLE